MIATTTKATALDTLKHDRDGCVAKGYTVHREPRRAAVRNQERHDGPYRDA